MDRHYYLELAHSGLSMPIGSDLILHEYLDPEAILLDGERLGRVLEETSRRFQTPLAFPHMDLELEKSELLTLLGIPEQEMAKYHFSHCPDTETFASVKAHASDPFRARLQAHIESIAYIAQHTELLPIGMAIGPFSLMTKLVGDPITPVCLAGMGVSADEDEEVKTVEWVLELGLKIILRSLEAQIAAGAKAIFIAEPAANQVYFSPNQLDEGSDIFERYVMAYNRQIKAYLDAHHVDLIFHCCGELTDYMLQKFAELDPAMLSLGSSRTLWEDARLLPKDIVLYGNLPSKKFYSDGLITVAEVARRTAETIRRMRAVGHPYIAGTECDVLSVPGCERIILGKVCAMLGSGVACSV